jgi:hypothetical protein
MIDYLLFAEVAALKQEIEQLTNERDEARRMYCQATHPPVKHCGHTDGAKEEAQWLGWDCFKEEETP